MTGTLTRPQDIGPSSVIAPGPHVGLIEVGDKIVLVDEPIGRGHALNPTASLVWRCLDGRSSLAEIIADLAEVYDAPEADITDDVVATAQVFGSLGLLDAVVRSVSSLPIEVEYADADVCDDVQHDEAPAARPDVHDAHLRVPPNP